MVSSKRGASLTEALVSLGLFAIAAAAVGSFLTGHIQRASWAYQRSYAYTLAEQELERLRAADYDSLSPASRTESAGATTFTITTSVVSDPSAPQVKTISVNVSWVDQRGPQNVLVSTSYAKVRR
jgi:Tfp pilus assembly protein PilV